MSSDYSITIKVLENISSQGLQQFFESLESEARAADAEIAELRQGMDKPVSDLIQRVDQLARKIEQNISYLKKQSAKSSRDEAKNLLLGKVEDYYRFGAIVDSLSLSLAE